MQQTVTEERWFTQLGGAERAKMRLYCFPYAGGSSNVFRRWSLYLPPSVQVVPVELAGHGKRLQEVPEKNLRKIVENMVTDIGPKLQPPFAFFGHSMGALIAYELTRSLRRYGMTMPAHLYVSAHLAPHAPPKREPIYNLPEKDFLSRLQDINGTPNQVLENKELRELFLPILRSDFQVCETYQYEDNLTLDQPITAFCGEQDKDVRPEDMDGWRNHTLSTFKLLTVPGDHFFLHSHEERFFYVLGEELNLLLNYCD